MADMEIFCDDLIIINLYAGYIFSIIKVFFISVIFQYLYKFTTEVKLGLWFIVRSKVTCSHNESFLFEFHK